MAPGSKSPLGEHSFGLCEAQLIDDFNNGAYVPKKEPTP